MMRSREEKKRRRPARIQLTEQDLRIWWQDGHEGHYPLADLRLQCPCANCREARGQPHGPQLVGAELPAITTSFGRKVLVVTGGNAGRHAGLIGKIRATVDAAEVFTVSGEPTVVLAELGAQRARALGCDIVIAIGGGSAIDAGKAIAALAANPGPALDYLEVVGRGQPLQRPPLPFIAVPTTAGTGAADSGFHELDPRRPGLR